MQQPEEFGDHGSRRPYESGAEALNLDFVSVVLIAWLMARRSDLGSFAFQQPQVELNTLRVAMTIRFFHGNLTTNPVEMTMHTWRDR